MSPTASITSCTASSSNPALTPEQAADAFKRTTGVVEHGLFLGIASKVVIGSADGLDFLTHAELRLAGRERQSAHHLVLL